ncbi:MAG: biopolymer transporter ExbD [Elusimicrobia bacterium]|nr:biopolymer transporter ExbD [Elusimicrobiota bacterium]
MTGANGEESAITGINVTPLVDIILVVLIIFMATAPLIHNRAIKVDLPKAAQHEKTSTEALSIVFNSRREITLAGRSVSPGELDRTLRSLSAASPDIHVSLRADKSIPYGEIIGLLDVVRGAGVRKIGLEVKAR